MLIKLFYQNMEFSNTRVFGHAITISIQEMFSYFNKEKQSKKATPFVTHLKISSRAILAVVSKLMNELKLRK